MATKYGWKLKGGHQGAHPTITESTTGTVACGDSWCDGRCGLPALTVQDGERELRVFGCMVAFGPVLQSFRVPWVGVKQPANLGSTPLDVVRKQVWM